MKFFKTLVLIMSIAFTIESHAQHLFPVKFSGCVMDQFAVERDTMTAKIEDAQLMQLLLKSLDHKSKTNIRGILSLQVIVDTTGNSCLLSLKNETNIKTKKLNLKAYIDNELKWQNPHKKVATLIIFNFEATGVKIKRLGINAKKGIHELTPN